MKEKRYILFDLDGTLFNTYPGISKTIAIILQDNKIDYDPADLRKCIGPPLLWSFENLFGCDEELAEKLVADYRKIYVPKGYVVDCEPYDGMLHILDSLYANGKKLMVASSKPQHMCEKVIEHFGLSDHFCFISGVMIGPDGIHSLKGHSTKKDTIQYALSENSIKDLEHAVMIGDRGSDMEAAKSLGIECIGVSYGFGSEEELQNSGADIIISHPGELAEILL